MSTHPNAILLLTLSPEGLSRKTMSAILSETGTKDDDDVKVGDHDYHHRVMESEYDDDWQLSAKEGDLLFFDLLTYGYGEQVLWEDLEKQKNKLEEWARGICERHHCSFTISITANYW